MEQGLLGFATLLIGLVAGWQPVELMVTAPVEQVRVLVDGTEVAVVSGPPWRATVNLGASPTPHHLVAIGHAGDGREVARAEQWINLPRPDVDLDLVLERDGSGRPLAARLAWASARPVRPAAVEAFLDGRPLVVDGVEVVALPEVDPKAAHFLRVEAQFPDGKSAVRELTFGGAYTDASTSSLTAIPVVPRAAAGNEPAPLEIEASVAGGESVRIAGVEKGGARVVVVIDPRATGALRRAAEVGEHSRRRRAPVWDEIATSCSWLREPLRTGGDEVFVVDPRPDAVVRASGASFLFTARGRSQTRLRDLVGVLMRTPAEDGGDLEASVTNAAASAGLVAAAGGHRRAVVLILGGSDDGGGDLGTTAARRFLSTIDVPLVVWSPLATVARRPTAWGPAIEVSTCKQLGVASRNLEQELGRQRIVWVEGLHRPQDVVLTSRVYVRLGG